MNKYEVTTQTSGQMLPLVTIVQADFLDWKETTGQVFFFIKTNMNCDKELIAVAPVFSFIKKIN